MSAFVEKRNSLRVDVNCKLHFKIDGVSQYLEITCINLSCSGISFLSKHDFQLGESVEIFILPETQVASESQFWVKIVRSEVQDDGQFLIGAAIDFDDEDQQD